MLTNEHTHWYADTDGKGIFKETLEVLILKFEDFKIRNFKWQDLKSYWSTANRFLNVKATC